MSDNNYVVGRGKLYFNRFADGTLVGPGYRYFGNTPELTASQSATSLDHYSSDEGMKFKDASVDLQNDMSGSFTCDNVNSDNLALFFLGANDTQTVVTGDATFAAGTVTFTGTGTAADTVTINGEEVTLETSGATGSEINVGVSATATAQNLKTLINNNPSIFGVTAAGAAAILTLTAIDAGPTGNAITLAKSSTGITISGATLTGATDNGTETFVGVQQGLFYPLGVTADDAQGVIGVSDVVVTIASVVIDPAGNYMVDGDTGLLQILDGAPDVPNDSTIDVAYSVAGGVRSVVIGSNDTIYGALRFYSKNPQGRQKDYTWPYVKLSPNGDLNLKGDDWQTVGWKFDVLQAGDVATGRVVIGDRVS